MINKYSVFDEAERFTNHMSNIITHDVRCIELSNFARSIIRIMNLDVEDKMYIYNTGDDKKVIILFAKNTEIGKRNSAYSTERVSFGVEEVDIIVLPNTDLLQNITNPEILTNLDYVYSFILKTSKPSVNYVSPLEICKHLYARYYFKIKFFVNSFEMDAETIESLKNDIEEKGLDTIINFQQLYDLANNKEITTEQLFDKNGILDYIDASVYYQILDDLRYMANESEEDDNEDSE